MSFDQRVRNNSSGSSTSSGGKMENNSPHSGYNSSNLPNASHGMGPHGQTGPNSVGANVVRGGPGMSPTYSYGPNAQAQMHRTDSMGSGPSPGVSPGPSPGPASGGGGPNAAGSVGVIQGAQAAAAAAVAAAANSAHAAAAAAHANKRSNQYPLNQQMQGQQPAPHPPQQGQFPQSFPQQQQWNQQGFRHQQQYNQGNGPPFPGGVPPSGDQTNFNQMPSSVPSDPMHGYMQPSSGNQMSSHSAATTLANSASGMLLVLHLKPMLLVKTHICDFLKWVYSKETNRSSPIPDFISSRSIANADWVVPTGKRLIWTVASDLPWTLRPKLCSLARLTLKGPGGGGGGGAESAPPPPRRFAR